ncbi:unnamed protein product [Lampetra fluviatilis]
MEQRVISCGAEARSQTRKSVGKRGHARRSLDNFLAEFNCGTTVAVAAVRCRVRTTLQGTINTGRGHPLLLDPARAEVCRVHVGRRHALPNSAALVAPRTRVPCARAPPRETTFESRGDTRGREAIHQRRADSLHV